MAARNHLGRRLHNWRLRNNLTLKQVARMLKTSNVNVHRWEKGKAEPNDRSRYRIEQLLAKRIPA